MSKQPRMYPYRRLTHRLVAEAFTPETLTRPTKTTLEPGDRIEVVRVFQGKVAFGLLRQTTGERLVFVAREVLVFERSVVL